MSYIPSSDRYSKMQYNRAGESSVLLPKIALGLWHNFGTNCDFCNAKNMIYFSFDNGINYFDLANNYGPEPGAGELTFAKILREGLMPFRDEILISTKAGHEMWEGPFGGNSSRKHLIVSLNQSLARLGLDYVDIFYTHRYDEQTPICETAQALIDIVRSGKALYIGISKYPPTKALELYDLLSEAKVPCLVSQFRYSLFDRELERESLALADEKGSGVVAFSPLAQGLLSDKYLVDIPSDSRAASESVFLTKDAITPEKRAQILALNQVAKERNEKLSQMALAWALRDSRVSSLVIGASSVAQIKENIEAVNSEYFTPEQLAKIDAITLK
ncbi:MAG: aldo/keto reductase [Rikenellaceae bacterium]